MHFPHFPTSPWFSFCRCYSTLRKSPYVQQPLNFVGGCRVDPIQSHEENPLIAPATGEVLRSVCSSGKQDVDRAVSSAREAFLIWSKRSGFERGQLMKKAAAVMRERVEELSQLEVLDTGKPIWEARLDVEGCADSIDFFAGLAASIAGEHTVLPGGSFAYTRREPLGVVGAIGAWNYPIQMAAWKSAPALACGNAMVFKPSPFTPVTSVMLAEIYTEVGLPTGCFNVVQGGSETGQMLSSHPDVNKMSFTGSVPTGSKIMEACSQDIKPVTLELGGKSPLIIFNDCNMANAVRGAIVANFLNQGQVCSNGTRVFVQRDILDTFLSNLVARTKTMKLGDPFLEDTSVGATITKEHAEKVLGYVETAKREGATVVYGGERVIPEDKRLSGGYYLSPCILINCHDDMTVVKQEVFGSVMSVMSFDTEDEVIRRANTTQFGLAGGIFTRDLNRAHNVAAKMEAGSIYVNNYNILPVGVPFGGFKKSGIGHENGIVTINYYTQLKSVYVEMGDVSGPV